MAAHVEVLEDRTLLSAITVSMAADDATLRLDTQDADADVDLVLDYTGSTSDYEFDVAAGDDVTITGTSGNDELTVDGVDLSSVNASLTINGADGDDVVFFDGGASDLGTGTLNVQADTVEVDADVSAGAINVETVRNIVVTNHGSLTAGTGDIALLANDGGTATASFVGIETHGAIQTSGGNIDIEGTGGTGNDGDGVRLWGSVISDGGNIDITGDGGNADDADGVGIGALIDSGVGNIVVTGTGGGSGQYGVYIFDVGSSYGKITSGTGNIHVTGTGTSPNTGVRMNGDVNVEISSTTGTILVESIDSDLNMSDHASILSDSGDITLDSTDDINVDVVETGGDVTITADSDDNGSYGGAIIDSNGAATNVTAESLSLSAGKDDIQLDTAVGTLTVTIVGTGVGSSYIDELDDVTVSNILTDSGLIDIDAGGTMTVLAATTAGTSGGIDLSGKTINVTGDIDTTAGSNADVTLTAVRNILMDNGSSITVGSGDVYMTANAGGTTSGHFTGIRLDHATITTIGGGDIELDGTGGDTDRYNYGVYLRSSHVKSTSAAANGGYINIVGHGGAGTHNNLGVGIAYADVRSKYGDITITGDGGGATTGHKFFNHGVQILQSDVVSTGTGFHAATINISGTGGDGWNQNHGVYIYGPGADVTSADGDIVITGHGQGANVVNQGVRFFGGVVESTGDGNIDITGTGDSGAAGVRMTGSSPKIISNTGTIDVESLDGNVSMDADAQILSNSGDIDVSGFDDIYVTTINADNDGDGVGGDIVIDPITVNIAGSISTAGSGTVDVVASRNIVMHSGSSISVEDGDVTLNANTDADKSGDFIAINVNDATITTTGSGDISLSGHGGDSGNNTVNNYGVYLHDGAVIESTDLATGGITINGTGGMAEDSNVGVLIVGSGGYWEAETSKVTSKNGAIAITGSSAVVDTIPEAENYNYGVYLNNGGLVESRGDAEVTINGTGGNGDGFGVGVRINDRSGVTSVDGAVNITGTGGNGLGVEFSGLSVARSTGTATIGITGTGSDGGNHNYGVYLHGGADVESTETGMIDITGTGGDGTDRNFGVYASGSGTTVTTVDGNVAITGTGQGSTIANLGVAVSHGALVESTGAGDISLTGQGADSGSNGYNHGVHMNGGVIVSSGSGNISLDGEGGDHGSNSYGIQLRDGATITTTGTGGISLDGDGGDGGYWHGDNFGVYLREGAVVESTTDGAIAIDGTGGDGRSQNFGVYITSNAKVASVDEGIAIGGLGAGIGSYNYGVYINADGKVTSQDGAIAIDGEASTSASGWWDFARGVVIDGGGQVESTGEATIDVTGTGHHSVGVYVLNAGSKVSSVSGEINVTGSGATSGGVRMDDGAQVVSSGTANITVSATGTSGAADVLLESRPGRDTAILSGAGDINVISEHSDVFLKENARIASTSGNVTVTADERIQMNSNASITVDSGDALLKANADGTATGDFAAINVNDSTITTTGTGDITLTGHGGDSDSYGYNNGVLLQNGAVVESMATGGGTITIDGTGGKGGAYFNAGVRITGDQTQVTSADGAITIDGIAGGDNAYNDGVNIDGDASVNSINGAIDIYGQGGTAGGTFNLGVVIGVGTVESVNGTIIIDGDGGHGYGSTGVLIGQNGTSVTSQTGDIAITGDGNGGGSYGVRLDDSYYGGVTISTSTGNIAVTSDGGDVRMDDKDRILSNSGNITLTSTDNVRISEINANNDADATAGDVTITAAGKITDGNAATDITGGTVTLNGTVAPGGGSTGQLVIDGNLVLGNDDTLEIGIDSASDYDRLVVTGDVTLGDALLTLLGSYVPESDDSFTIIENDGSNSVTGTFSNSSPITFNGKDLEIDYNGGDGNDVLLEVVDELLAA